MGFGLASPVSASLKLESNFLTLFPLPERAPSSPPQAAMQGEAARR
jgi:hypothetical protein